MDEDDDGNPIEPTGPSKDCACDNCFYGRHKLADALIDMEARLAVANRAFIQGAHLKTALMAAEQYIRERVTNPDRGKVGLALLPKLQAAIAYARDVATK